MRTTLTLDDDIATRLRKEMQRTGDSFKKTVNTILRLGLKTRGQTPPTRRLVIEARDLGARPGIDFEKIGELLEEIEGPLHR